MLYSCTYMTTVGVKGLSHSEKLIGTSIHLQW